MSVSVKDLKKKLDKFAKMCEGDKDKEEFAKAFAKDIVSFEAAVELKGSPAVLELSGELKEEMERRQKAVMEACDLDKSSDAGIRNGIITYRLIGRLLAAIEGPKLEDIDKKLDSSIAALEEEAKENTASA